MRYPSWNELNTLYIARFKNAHSYTVGLAHPEILEKCILDTRHDLLLCHIMVPEGEEQCAYDIQTDPL